MFHNLGAAAIKHLWRHCLSWKCLWIHNINREMEMVTSVGVAPSRVIYAHPVKPQSHIRYACAQGVDMMTFDCEEELLKIATCFPKAKLVLRISVDDSKSIIKLNSKFGAHLQTVGDLLKRAQELHLNVIGVSFHVGGLCLECEAYKKAIADARQVFDLAKTLGLALSLLDIGGGLNGKSNNQTSFQQMSIGINEALDEFFPADCGVRIIAEPGRYFVDTGFTLAVNIFGKKCIQCDPPQNQETSGKHLDRTVLYYVSDGVYGSVKMYKSDIYNFYPHLPRVEVSEPRYKSVLFGPTCDSADRITDTIWMPELNVGEWVLVDNIGAYTLVVAGDFNGFEKAQIYPVVTAQTWKILSQNWNK